MRLHYEKQDPIKVRLYGKPGRVSLNGTKEELRSLHGRLAAVLDQMDARDAELAAAAHAVAQAQGHSEPRPSGGHFVDFPLDEVFEIEELDLDRTEPA